MNIDLLNLSVSNTSIEFQPIIERKYPYKNTTTTTPKDMITQYLKN